MVSALSSGEKAAIVDHCDSIKDNLKNVQKKDRQARVYLGRLYETIQNKLETPLTLRLVENYIPHNSLIENRDSFAERRIRFNEDYVFYQQALDELIATDCKSEPEKFYSVLTKVRDKRKIVNSDVTALRGLVTEQIKIVLGIKDKL